MNKAFKVITGLLILLLFSCTESNGDSQNQKKELDYPQLKEEQIARFDKPVQKQFREKYRYIRYLQSVKTQKNDNSGWAVGELGKLFHAYQMHKKAMICYQIAEDLDPNSWEWSYMLGHIYNGTGELDKAVMSFKKALLLNNESYINYWLGDSFLENNQLPEAQSKFEHVLKSNPDHIGSLLGLSEIYIQNQNFSMAKKLLLKAVKINPSAYQVNYKLGQVFAMMGDTNNSKIFHEKVPNDENKRISFKIYDPVMQEISDLRLSSQSLLRKGHKALAQKQYKQALQFYKSSSEANPERLDSKFGTAVAYFKIGALDKSQGLILEIITENADNPDYFSLLAKIKELEKKMLEAEKNYRKAFQISKKPKESIQLVKFYLRINYKDKAQETLNEAKKYAPNDIELNHLFRDISSQDK